MRIDVSGSCVVVWELLAVGLVFVWAGVDEVSVGLSGVVVPVASAFWVVEVLPQATSNPVRRTSANSFRRDA
jgi:RsiW-degrading membrane proteinase PrsW (M82 family)